MVCACEECLEAIEYTVSTLYKFERQARHELASQTCTKSSLSEDEKKRFNTFPVGKVDSVLLKIGVVLDKNIDAYIQDMRLKCRRFYS